MTGTNATSDPDAVVAAWLDDVPTDLPDVTRRAILGALRTTPQARRGPFAPWRSMQLARAAVVLLVAIVVIGTAALLVGPRTVGGPGPSAVPSPESSASSTPSAAGSAPPLPKLDATFTSRSYGYRIRYPKGWTVTNGAGPWPIGTNLLPGNPTSDSIVTPSGLDRMRISIASIALPSGWTIEQFRTFASPYSSPFVPDPCRPEAPLTGPVRIDELPGPGKRSEKVDAVVSINGCRALAELGGHVYDLELIAAGRGYEFTLDGQLSPADALAWLAAITLEPTNALTASAAPDPSASR